MSIQPVPCTEYVLPNGRQRSTWFVCADNDTYNKAKAFIDAGYAFEYEFLCAGDLSCTLAGRELEIDVEIELALQVHRKTKQPLAELLSETFTKLIDKAYLRWAGHQTKAGEEWPNA